LCDALVTLGQLNKTFHIPTYHPCDAHRKVNEVIKALKTGTSKERYGGVPMLQNVLQKLGTTLLSLMKQKYIDKQKNRKDLRKM